MVDRTTRPDGRRPDEVRPIKLTLDFVPYPEGSVLIELGGTRVLCNASIEDKVPPWMAGRGTGWLTAEYALLPRSTHTRTPRETQGLQSRTQEIRRMIGRSLRPAVNLDLLGERTLTLDCDVLQADGGTRTASVTGGYVALALTLVPEVLKAPVAAVSVGIVAGEVCADLCYAEDRIAEVDLNVAMAADGRLVELQGTAERSPFERAALERMLDMAARAIAYLIDRQREALK